ncbi:MAG: patatin-like phospholipase family protein [Microcystaceae cyanobacterium]
MILLIFILAALILLQIFREYLSPVYLVRIPLIGGAILVALPIIAETQSASKFLQNIFVVESGIQLIIILFGSTLGSIVLVSNIKNILVLIYDQVDEEESERNHYSITFLILRIVLTFALFLPIWISLAFNSILRNENQTIGWGSFLIGATISLISLFCTIFYDLRSSSPEQEDDAFITQRKITYAVQLGVGIIFYAITILLNWPDDQGKMILPNSWQAPTLLYVILIIVGMTLLIGGLNYAIDKYYLTKYSDVTANISLYSFIFPVIILLILFSGLMYGIFGVDHYFELPTSNVATISYEDDIKTAVGKRLCPEDFQKNQSCQKEQTLVVVAASGGGIQASGWMAQVLAGLQHELGEEFTKNIGLISSVSGGSVGTMFYLDKFDNGSLQEPQTMIKNATDDWLDSVGWGLAFPDSLRLIGYPLALFNQQYKYLDRGYALEKDWQRTLERTDKTLDYWYNQAIQGEIPIPIFNSTIVENGRRFLVSPFKLLPGTMANYLNLSTDGLDQEAKKKIKQSKAFDFRTLYHSCGDSQDQMCDLEITTASRLSATFPYVSPMARNYPDNVIQDGNDSYMQNYHIADGGYFDNAGAVTALEWLDNLLAKYPELNIKKVSFVQINAFPDSQLEKDQSGNKGFLTVGLGPLTALNGVRNSTQIARNIYNFKLISDRWIDEGVDIQGFVFTFPEQDQEGEQYNQPLSWRLTLTQKKNLKKAWCTDPMIHDQLEHLNKFWADKEGQMNSKECAEFS